MTKESLVKMVNETSVRDANSTMTLLLTVLLKYGIAPIACIYLGYVLMLKDAVIQKNTETMFGLVKEQTTATTKQVVVMETLSKNIEANTRKLEDMEIKAK